MGQTELFSNRASLSGGRLDGPTLLQATRNDAVTFAGAGAIIASLGLSVHRMPPPPKAFDLRGWIDTAFGLSSDIVPKHIASGILALIDRLQQPMATSTLET
jgi:hypothetical protein